MNADSCAEANEADRLEGRPITLADQIARWTAGKIGSTARSGFGASSLGNADRADELSAPAQPLPNWPGDANACSSARTLMCMTRTGSY